MLSSPCGLLRWDSSRNGHFARGLSLSQRDAETQSHLPQTRLRRPNGTQGGPPRPTPPRPSRSLPGRVAPLLEPTSAVQNTDLGNPSEGRLTPPPPAPRSHRSSQGWWQPRGPEDPGLPGAQRSALSPSAPRRNAATALRLLYHD